MRKFFSMTAMAAAMLMSAASFAAPSVYFVPADQGVSAGSAGSVAVWVGGTDVGAFDLNIHASNANLSWVDALYSAADPLGAGRGAGPPRRIGAGWRPAGSHD